MHNKIAKKMFQDYQVTELSKTEKQCRSHEAEKSEIYVCVIYVCVRVCCMYACHSLLFGSIPLLNVSLGTYKFSQKKLRFSHFSIMQSTYDHLLMIKEQVKILNCCPTAQLLTNSTLDKILNQQLELQTHSKIIVSRHIYFTSRLLCMKYIE